MKANFENRSDIIRDMNNKAILYVNKEKLLDYKSKKELTNKYDNLTSDINNIKNEIKDLKNNLKELISCMKETLQNENRKIN